MPKKIINLNKVIILISKLKKQPLIIVFRPGNKEFKNQRIDQNILTLIESIYKSGIVNIEIAWSPHPNWPKFVKEIFRVINNITFGAASITKNSALRLITDLGFAYAMSPFFDENMLQEAKELGQLLIPGVFSPSEIQRAINSNCSIIKLFPASSLGVNYLNNLKIPLNSLPLVIAAGGLKAQDINTYEDWEFDCSLPIDSVMLLKLNPRALKACQK